MAMMLQLIFVLCTLISITVSSDVARSVGDSVQLDYGQHSEKNFSSLVWVFNGANNVLKYDKKYNDITVYPPYEDRAVFNDKTYSLTLKNLQKIDSGLYTVKVSEKKDTVVAEYRLSVLDSVEAPVLTVQDKDPCNITLTCTAHNLSIHSICDKGICKEKKNTSSEGDVTLSLSFKDGKNICTLSNPVGRVISPLDMDLKGLCEDGLPNWIWPVVGVAVLIILIPVSIFIYRKVSAGRRQEREIT